ncbi:MAG: hypothetical protein AAF289_03200 [Cyanobacteria bacterium P01_A01_bin.135]
MANQVNCAVDCVDGCVLGDDCPNQDYKDQASTFIQETSLDDMLAIADEAVKKKRMQAPKWVFPEDGI